MVAYLPKKPKVKRDARTRSRRCEPASSIQRNSGAHTVFHKTRRPRICSIRQQDGVAESAESVAPGPGLLEQRRPPGVACKKRATSDRHRPKEFKRGAPCARGVWARTYGLPEARAQRCTHARLRRPRAQNKSKAKPPRTGLGSGLARLAQPPRRQPRPHDEMSTRRGLGTLTKSLGTRRQAPRGAGQGQDGCGPTLNR